MGAARPIGNGEKELHLALLEELLAQLQGRGHLALVQLLLAVLEVCNCGLALGDGLVARRLELGLELRGPLRLLLEELQRLLDARLRGRVAVVVGLRLRVGSAIVSDRPECFS